MRLLTILLLLANLVSCKTEPKENIVKNFSWKEVASPVKGSAMQPYLFSNKTNLLLSWTSKHNDSISSLNYASLINNQWNEVTEIAKGKDWFVNWADFPGIAENNGNILSYYLKKSDEATFAYDILVKHATKSGWKEPFKLHSDTTKTEHGFVSMMPYKETSFFTAWLDGRKTSGGHKHHNEGGAMTIRVAEIGDNGKKINELELDAKTCDCCQTSAAITQNGPIVVYRDRSDDEIRDIFISRFLNDEWTLPKPVFNDGWKIAGCPVNGPKAVALDNQLAIAWFTDANRSANVKVIFSNDNGKKFDQPIIIDSKEALGRVDLAFLNKDVVLVSWMRSNEDKAEICISKVHRKEGKMSEHVITNVVSSRATGFPQLKIFNDQVYLAFNAIEEANSNIKILTIAKHVFE